MYLRRQRNLALSATISKASFRNAISAQLHVERFLNLIDRACQDNSPRRLVAFDDCQAIFVRELFDGFKVIRVCSVSHPIIGAVSKRSLTRGCLGKIGISAAAPQDER